MPRRQSFPQALAKARPGSAEFRAALRDALEQLPAARRAQGLFNLSPQNHNRLDQRARMVMPAKGGQLVLVTA